MKTKRYPRFIAAVSAIPAIGALLAAIVLIGAAPAARAQGNTVTVSAAEFQRLVYSAQLHTQLALKPELEASLNVLLQLQRRNPNADPAGLAALTRQALQIYRASAPCYIRTNGESDEVLAAYLDAVRQVPAHTNFVSANLSLLNLFMFGAADYNAFTNSTPLDLINSTVQRLSSTEREALKRQALVDGCVARARSNSRFATSMDLLLLPETGVLLADAPAAIISMTNSPLHNSPTMTNLLALSQASGNGSFTVCTNQLMNLFTDEMQTIWNTIHTNLAVLSQINQGQPDLLSYLTNQAAIDANVQLVTGAQQGQPPAIACATAAVLVHSALLPIATPEDAVMKAQIKDEVSGLARIAIGVISIACGSPSGARQLVSGGLDLFNMFNEGKPQPMETRLSTQITNVQIMLGDLSANMNYRFDRLDQSLTTIFNTMSQQFGKMDLSLGQLNGSVYDVRNSLVSVQASLDRIECENFANFSAAQNQDFVAKVNKDLLWEVRHPLLDPVTLSEYQDAAALFYTYATYDAENAISSPTFSPASLPPLQSRLGNFPLVANLNYIKAFLGGRLQQQTGGKEPLSNPEEWFIAADAYLQLAGENPLWFRKVGAADLGTIIGRGSNLVNFCTSLTFSGTNINWPLFTALENYYLTNLMSFNAQVSAFEGTYATNNGFAVGAWRRCYAGAPRVTAAATELRYAPAIPSIMVHRGFATNITAGQWHNLALKTDGTVVGWGGNASGQATVPVGLTNCLAIAAGGSHSLALKADGTVVGWGENSRGQTNVPAGLTNMTAIAAGADYSLALKADGTVAGWGDSAYSPSAIPAGLSNVAAIAAGAVHCVALKTDGTVIGWGDSSCGQANVPAGLSNVVSVAAGAAHSLALKADGTVVGWGAGSPAALDHALSFNGSGNVVTVANQAALDAYPLTVSAWIKTASASGFAGIVNKYVSSSINGYQLFLRDGNLRAWYFQGPVSGGFRGVFDGGDGLNGGFVADGGWHHVAFVVDAGGGRLYVDGNLKASRPWTGAPGATTTSQPVTLGAYPGSPGGGFYNGLMDEVRIWNVACSQTDIQAGMWHGLTGREPGLVAYWKLNEGAGATATNSAVTTGSACDGQLAGPAWAPGWAEFGQATIPPGLSKVVAIAAGDYHSLALKADGTLVAWGDNTYCQTNVSPDAKDVVAIAGGGRHSSALKTDGTVVVWGDNSQHQGFIPPALTWRGAIVAGVGHGLALEPDGTVTSWGDNSYGQINIPAGLTNVVAAAAGGGHSLAIEADGTVLGWGDNSYGQVNIPAGLTNVVAIAAGERHSLALRANGTFVFWGDTSWGQGNIPAGLSNIVAISAGGRHSLALKADGTVVAWGYNDYGQTNTPSSLTHVVDIAAGGDHSLALTAEGTVVGWGYNYYGQVNIPAGLTNVVAIAAGWYHNLALKADGNLVVWGNNQYGQINIPAGLTNVVAIATCGANCMALTSDGNLVVWGCNGRGQNVPPAAWTDVVAIAAGSGHDLALKADGTVVVWGDNVYGQINIPNGLTNVVQIAAGDMHSLALKADGTVVGWGNNFYHETNVPSGLNNVVAIAAGSSFSLALKADGTVVGWGLNNYGETSFPSSLNNVVAIAARDWHCLGLKADGTVVGWGLNSSGELTIPAGLNNVVAIAAGSRHSLALRADGTLAGWGDNSYGQLNIPASLSNVVAVAAGAYHSLALKADGTVVGWGMNSAGQVNIPSGLSNVVAMAGAYDRSLFLTATGAGGPAANGGLSFVRAKIPTRVPPMLLDCVQNTIHELGLTGSALDTAAAQLTGSKMLLAAVLELGMPYTLAHDDVLHGFLYGSESLTDTTIATNFLQTLNAQLQNSASTPRPTLVEWDWLSYARFQDRLNQCLTNLQANAQPEIPRLVGHTLRLLNLLRDASTPPANSPPPALELWTENHSPRLLLYGEPYVRYTLQYSDSLSAQGWTNTTSIYLRDGQTNTLPFSGGLQRFYRAMLPAP